MVLKDDSLLDRLRVLGQATDECARHREASPNIGDEKASTKTQVLFGNRMFGRMDREGGLHRMKNVTGNSVRRFEFDLGRSQRDWPSRLLCPP